MVFNFYLGVKYNRSKSPNQLEKNMNATQYNAWIDAKAQLDHWKKVEKEMRETICEHFLEGKTVGVHTFHPTGFKVKATKKITTSLDGKVLSAMWDDLSDAEQGCVTFKPTLVAGKYKQCGNHETLDQALVTKPAMPTLSIEVED